MRAANPRNNRNYYPNHPAGQLHFLYILSPNEYKQVVFRGRQESLSVLVIPEDLLPMTATAIT